MPNQHHKDPQRRRSKQQERAEQILDVAAALIVRWGYSKTTLDDIAKQVGVAKGTIYLHWKSREDLFLALLTREELKLLEDTKQRIANDPGGLTFHGYLKHNMLAFMKSPVMKALLLNDTEILGPLVSRTQSSTTFTERIANSRLLLEFLRTYGIAGAEFDIREQIYILSAIWMGFLLIDPWMPDEYQFSDEAVAEMLAETVERLLAPHHMASEKAGDTGTAQQVAEALTRYIDQEVNTLKRTQKEVQV
ncbi:MAG: TetR/AcrR family transcriptional regulator [Ktedonobacteraceae bacterium]|nr:TetR/AcrR family transcriptional regulator [Ktedonobacteraceae bacterium]